MTDSRLFVGRRVHIVLDAETGNIISVSREGAGGVVPEYNDGVGEYTCGNCRFVVGIVRHITGEVEKLCRYCPDCGKAVNWDG